MKRIRARVSRCAGLTHEGVSHVAITKSSPGSRPFASAQATRFAIKTRPQMLVRIAPDFMGRPGQGQHSVLGRMSERALSSRAWVQKRFRASGGIEATSIGWGIMLKPSDPP
jgi:hypothetical protein